MSLLSCLCHELLCVDVDFGNFAAKDVLSLLSYLCHEILCVDVDFSMAIEFYVFEIKGFFFSSFTDPLDSAVFLLLFFCLFVCFLLFFVLFFFCSSLLCFVCLCLVCCVFL